MTPSTSADVLDLATGTGFVALILAGLGHRVTAIDLSTEMMEIARRAAQKRGLSIDFRETDAVSPDLPAEAFDVITSRHLLWTLRDAEQPAGTTEPGPFERY